MGSLNLDKRYSRVKYCVSYTYYNAKCKFSRKNTLFIKINLQTIDEANQLPSHSVNCVPNAG